MILEHEIPKGSRLYFGNIAKRKRQLENKISSFLYEHKFEEIITPNFSYSQHQSIEDNNKLITFFDQKNHSLALRADSTLDVVRIITKRLGRTTSHKKWFYIQPVFTYASNEDYQIGCEWINHDNMIDILNLTASIIKLLNVEPILQLANINIPKIVANELNIDISLFKNGEIAKLFELNCTWLNSLIKVKTIDDIKELLPNAPEEIAKELKILLDIANQIEYKNLIISPLYYSSLKYYNGIYYRVVQDNLTICRGGKYNSLGISSLGFAFYTDSLLKILED